MKILYIYERMPGTYQKYLANLLVLMQSSLNVKTLVYRKDVTESNYVIKTYGINDYFQRALFKLKVTKVKSSDVKIFNQFDILHVQHSYLFSKIESLLSNSRKSKIVITLRGADTYLKPWVDQRWKDFYINKGNLIDAFITMSQNQKEYLQKWGISADRIHVIPVSFGPHSNAAPKYPHEKILMLVSAFRMTWEKNIEGSIQFAKILKEKGVYFQYDIYGDGNDLGQLHYLVDKYKLSNCVSIKDKIDNDQLKKKLVDYDLFLQLSVSEALSVSVLEAQSMGLPCIVSDSDGLPEAVLKGKTAIVYPYNNIEVAVRECLKIWKDKELYYSYSREAINYVNTNFTMQHEKEKLEKLYKSLV